jgi:hypothetical protein
MKIYAERRDRNQTERFRSAPGRIINGENYLVCRNVTGSHEVIVQSDRNPERAQHSVDCLNEHEELNARNPVYYWRPRTEDEKSYE